MYCGGPTKDHILESACSGLALFDYDGDGLLDIYLVTAPELTPARERVAHRNALYRNLGGWKFEDVSRQSGVDLAAWGSGACVGDFDGDGRLDLYVTNWGPNALFRNRGDGTFENVAARAGVEAGGWSTGCTFFDADGDGDLDLYVANDKAYNAQDRFSPQERAFDQVVHRTGPRAFEVGERYLDTVSARRGDVDRVVSHRATIPFTKRHRGFLRLPIADIKGSLIFRD
jgi:hypothetical protein